MNDSTVWTYLLLLISILFSSAAQIFQKLASEDLKSHSGSTLQLFFKPNILLSIFFLGTGLLLWLAVLGKLELSIAYPMLSLGYVLVMLAAKFIFNEQIPFRRWLGALIIVLGITLLVGVPS